MRRRGASLVSVVFVVVVAAVYVVLALLGKVPSPVKDLGGSLSGTSALSGDALYAELDSLLTSPDRKSDLGGKFTFTAYIATEPEEVTFDDEKDVVHQYQEGWISRNEQHYFLLDVKDLPEPLETRKFYTVTGTLDGSVYWTEDGERVEVLLVKASEITPLLETDVKANTTATVDVESVSGKGTVEFKNAHYSENNFGKVVVLYYNFTNTGASDVAPMTGKLDIYLGADVENAQLTERTSFEPKESDGSALSALGAIVTKTFVGKTTLYFLTLTVPDDADGNLLTIEYWNDDYDLTYQYTIEVAESLAG
jgi:hypothetical protein